MRIPAVPVIYILPKIHKDPENPPGRPDVKYVTKLPSYLKDTIDTIQFINNITWKKGYIIGTCDVTSLYTIIDHKLGIQAVRYYLDEDISLKNHQKEFQLKSIDFILTKNYFWFEGDYYLQTKGTAMGTRFAPSYANFFMGMWEQNNIIPQLNKDVGLITWKHYIDDCLFIWKGSENDLTIFLEGLNNNTSNITFTSNYSTSNVNFLDLNIYVEKDNNFIQFITTYNNSNKELETIIQKHWHILLKDKDLHDHLSANPHIIDKKPRTMKQMLVPSCLPSKKQKQTSDPFNTGVSNGFFACRTCKGCKTSKVNERKVTNFKSNVTNVEFAIKDITCNSNNVIYLLQCPCSLQYIGRTNRNLKTRIGEHMNNIKKGLLTHRGQFTKIRSCARRNFAALGRTSPGVVSPALRKFTKIRSCAQGVSAHFKTYHNSDPSLLQFTGIVSKKTHWRGGDIVNIISREETLWIHKLKTLTPQGLNIDIDLKCFLND
ncbi:hypothetical protein XELAEV_18004940mg [Xenopus laevis]|uniref:Reverse transcriptase domain-containing protein n=1 Tax=Xenopus laevis TaxID=8355 RepID=A0A974DWC3_XENLA|nr:hypothetical protein XELAEV_18004940mg [Xenopus laevis]